MTQTKKMSTDGQSVDGTTWAQADVQTNESIAQPIPDGKTADFLAHLHRGGLWAYYWTPDGEEYIKDGKTERHKESIWYSTKRGQRLPAHWADRRNCYFGVHPTKEAGTTSQRSTKNTVSAVNCFYAEFDAKDFPNKQAIPDHLDASLTDYRAGVGGFPYPSVIVDSGGGYHCYWLLEHTVTLTDENRNIVARIQAAWVDVVGGDGGAKDLPRVLRLPGTQNRKSEYGPNFPTVHFVEYNLGRLYQLSDFETLTFDLRNVTLKPAQNAPQTAQNGQGGALPGDGEVWDVLFSGPYGEDARRLYGGDLSAHGGDHSKADYALSKHLAYILGDDPSAIDRLFRQSALMRDKWADRADYRDATISKAIGSTSKHFDWAAHRAFQERRKAQTTAQPIHTNGTGAHMDEPPGWIGADEWTPDEPPDAHRAAQTPGPGPSSPKIADRELFTDLGNARRFTRLHGPKFHYTQQWGWLAWTGQRWEMDSTGAVMRAAKDTAVGYYAEAAGKQDAAKRLNEQAAADGLTDPQRAKLAEDAGKLAGIAGAMNTWAKTCQGRARLESMVKLAESELPIATKTDDFNLKPWALNVQNGTVDLRTGKLQPHERGDLLTALAPVDYEPGALCPTWDKFLHRIMDGDTEMVDFLRRAIGYSLTGDVSEQKLFFPHGGGSNGKSTFITTLLSLLGQDYAAQAAPELLVVGKDRHPTEVADLYGKRLVASIEVEDGRRLAEGLVKQLTGGDKIKARLMRQDFFQFDPTHKMWLVANHKPVVKGTDYAIWRRILLIPFDVTITDEEKDPQLLAKLLAEGPGILAWAVRGCLEWQRQGLGVPESVKRATAAYRGDSDTLALFLAECTVHVNTARTKASHLYARYEKWCKDNGEAPIGGTPFGRALTERGMGKETNYQGVFYLGLGLATEDQKPE